MDVLEAAEEVEEEEAVDEALLVELDAMELVAADDDAETEAELEDADDELSATLTPER